MKTKNGNVFDVCGLLILQSAKFQYLSYLSLIC